MVTLQGFPQDGGCYEGYNVIHNGQVVGKIGVCGNFKNETGAVFTEEERLVLRQMSQGVYEMPSEYGLLGVGDSPAQPYEEFVKKYPNWFVF